MSLSERFDEALRFAHDLHRRQRRKGDDTPYIAHLLGVASLALEAGADEDEAIAALLHDAVEDQGGSAALAAIRERFGATVATIVEGCSEWDGVGDRPAWRARKERHIAQLAGASPSVLLIAGADKLHNARALLADYRKHGEALWRRFNGGRDGTLWYYEAVTRVLALAGAPQPLVRELTRTVAELHRAAETGMSDTGFSDSG